ncbi:DUF3593 domain-containing protein [Trichothermofontia sp.]
MTVVVPNLISPGLLPDPLPLVSWSGSLLLAHISLPSKDTLFALSLFPYLGFLWFLTRSRQAPRLALIGFYTTLVFVGVTIPAGIYARVVYQQALANVDWLHGSAEVFLTLANILIVLGFRQAVLAQRAHNRETS